jgi:hypothetical protein
MPAVPLAYKYVATAVMLMEINYCAARLHLPLKSPIGERDIKQQYIFHPSVIGFAGALDTQKYSFSFARSGRLRYIVNVGHPYYRMKAGSPEKRAYFESLTQKTSLIDINGAYRMATNWLGAIGVDVLKLERQHQPMTRQLLYLNRSPIPLFEITWDNGGLRMSNGRPNPVPAISVLLAGDSGELIHLRQEDDTYSARPVSLIKDTETLLAISDDEFARYSPEERSNLVVRFAAVKYAGVDVDSSSAGQSTSLPKAPR